EHHPSCAGAPSLDLDRTERGRHRADGARRRARRRRGGVGERPPRDAGAIRGAVGPRRVLVAPRRRLRGARLHALRRSRVMIRVVLVDDQTLVRRGIRALLELAGDITIVAEAGDGLDGAAAIRREKPDVVLLDVRMPKTGGLDLLRDLRDAHELPPTILLTTFDDDEALLEGVKAGARGYLLKDVSLEELTGAIRSVAAGETLI